MKKNLISSVIFSLVITFAFSSCVEHHYYQKNQRHSEKYEHRHHKQGHQGVGVNLNIHN